MTRDTQTRRTFLAGAGATAVAALAGCSGDSEDGGDQMTTDGMGDGGMSDGGMNDDGGMTEEGMGDGGMTEGEMTEGEMTEGGMQSSSTLAFDFDHLPALAQGTYEGWAIFGDEKVSTGRFSADGEHSVAADRDLTEADRIVVTVEPETDDDPAPSGVVILAGDQSGGTADLSFPADFGDVAGSYILATPTNGGDTDETSGIWFLDPSGGGPSATLHLPDLPSGWVYEGWAVHGGTPITSGRFSSPSGADDFDGYSDDMDAPPFPGEDYLRNAPGDLSFPIDLTDGESMVVVSVEPDIDGMDPTGSAPFDIKPLVDSVPGDGTDHTSYELEQNLATVPSGSASIM